MQNVKRTVAKKANINNIHLGQRDWVSAGLQRNENNMRYEFISSAAAMAANGNLSEITPWRIIIDTEEQTITVSKRNKFLIGTDQETLAFRFIRRVEINEHLIGADITIQAVGGKLTACSMAKNDCKRIRQILMEHNKKSGTKSIVFS